MSCQKILLAKGCVINQVSKTFHEKNAKVYSNMLKSIQEQLKQKLEDRRIDILIKLEKVEEDAQKRIEQEFILGIHDIKHEDHSKKWFSQIYEKFNNR